MKSVSIKIKILNALLILTSLMGYLEWGKDKHAFLFQVEGQILLRLINEPVAVAHPFTVLPMIGQLILLTTLFQKNPGKLLTFMGMAGIGILLTFMFIIGLISLNVKILLSTVPFLVIAFLTIRLLKTEASKTK
jgi:cobalamin biosynthesis protein CobD/CbiB